MTEYEGARLLASSVLMRRNCDPDDDLCVLARQLLRADERAAALAKALGSAKATLDGIAAANWRAWGELGAIEEFETWAKSRSRFELEKITELGGEMMIDEVRDDEYVVSGMCGNCGYRGRIMVKKGTTAPDRMHCPYCECATFVPANYFNKANKVTM